MHRRVHHIKRKLYLALIFNLVYIEVLLREANELYNLSGIIILMIVAVSSVPSNHGFISLFCLHNFSHKIKLLVFAKLLNP